MREKIEKNTCRIKCSKFGQQQNIKEMVKLIFIIVVWTVFFKKVSNLLEL